MQYVESLQSSLPNHFLSTSVFKVSVLATSLLCHSMALANDASEIPHLPEPVTNNAAVLVHTDKDSHLISFMGLAQGKTWRDVHNKVWSLALSSDRADEQNAQQWQARKAVPSSLPLSGRLASVAVAVETEAFIFGGYTVAEDHTEISSPDNFAYSVMSDTYRRISPTPVPTDDAIALAYQEKYIYLISGWHNDGNVNLVQVYDVEEDTWQQASPFLGKPVFGHAGGIVGRNIVVCDGVAVVPKTDARRTFAMETACYSGVINEQDPVKVDWRVITHPTALGRYRMAASGVSANFNLNGNNTFIEGVLFVGGATNPYNYDGIGYNKQPSEPDNLAWLFDVNTQQWWTAPLSFTTMDHRALLLAPNSLINHESVSEEGILSSDINKDDIQDASQKGRENQSAIIIGGMGKKQKVSAEIQQFSLSSLVFQPVDR